MKLIILGMITVALAAMTGQTAIAQNPPDSIKTRGCLTGDGSKENPWILKDAELPPVSSAAPAAPAQGGRGAGAGRGGAPAGRGGGAAPAPGGANGGRGGGGGRGDVAPALADLRLTGVDMKPWRNMFVEIEGTLGPAPASGMRELKVMAARSAYGDCR